MRLLFANEDRLKAGKAEDLKAGIWRLAFTQVQDWLRLNGKDWAESWLGPLSLWLVLVCKPFTTAKQAGHQSSKMSLYTLHQRSFKPEA